MRTFYSRLTMLLVCLCCSYAVIVGHETTDLKQFADSAMLAAGKPEFLPIGKRYLKIAKGQNDTIGIRDAYSGITHHYYVLGDIDSLRLVTYEYMAWADSCHRSSDRYQAWRQYIQRMTEKGMQEASMHETELLCKDADVRKDKYGLASGAMCVGYNHRIFGKNIKLCLEYYDSALKHFEEAKCYRDACIVSLNIIQTNLSRRLYSDAIPYLERLKDLKNTVESNGQVMDVSVNMRYYEFYVIAILGTEGKEAAKPFIRNADTYYNENKEWISQEAWFGYKIMCCQILGDARGGLTYMDSLLSYHRSIGNFYPENYRQKAIMLEELGDYKEACQAFADYSQLNDSVRTAELDEQLNKYTVQFEVDRLNMEKLELSDKMNRERLQLVLVAGCVILALLLLVSYLYFRTLFMNRKLGAAHKEIQKVNRIKSSFIQHITHELRTPLNSVVGFSTLLAEGGQSEEETCEYSGQVEKNTAYLLELIDSIIDIADIDSQTSDIQKEAVNVNACCGECVDAMRGKLKEGVELEWTPAPGNPVMQTVYLWVQRVVTILLDNAKKFTAQGVIRLSCTEDKTHGVMRFVIEDTGIGVDPQYKDSIFERFFKVDSFTPGIGLGLAIAKQIMDIIDGRIYLDTSYTGGTRVVVEWPLNSLLVLKNNKNNQN